jgi:mTERF domain-containing protein
MLRLRSCVLTHLLSSPSASPSPSSLHRLISAAAPAVSSNPGFAVEDYLVATCGLTRAQALKASTKLSHVKSPSKPDAVLAFLAGLGISSADVADLVAKDPLLLCTSVDKTLAPNVADLTGLGFSVSEIARLVSIGRAGFRRRSIVSKLHYYLPLFVSIQNLLRALKFNDNILKYGLERSQRATKLNLAVLRECGLGVCDIAKLFIAVPWMLTASVERVRAIVACADGVGVPRESRMFRHALHAAACLGKGKIADKVEFLKKTFRWSDAEVGIAVSKLPFVLLRSKEALQSRSEFLISELGLEPAYIAHRPAMLSYNLERRLRPRYYVVKFLKENELLERERDYYSTVTISDKVFMDKFIHPHKEAAPHLAEDYATVCSGEVPARFLFA